MLKSVGIVPEKETEKPVVKPKKVTETPKAPVKTAQKSEKKEAEKKKVNETPMYVRPYLEDPIFLQPDDREVAMLHPD